MDIILQAKQWPIHISSANLIIMNFSKYNNFHQPNHPLNRDLYEPDYTSKYRPVCNFSSFQYAISTRAVQFLPKASSTLIIHKINLLKSVLFGIVLSTLPILLFYRRIPYIKSTSTEVRVLSSLAIVAWGFFAFAKFPAVMGLEGVEDKVYMGLGDGWRQYMLTGDCRSINPKVVLEELQEIELVAEQRKWN